MKQQIAMLCFFLSFSLFAAGQTFQFEGDGDELTSKNILDSINKLAADETADFTKTMKSFDVGFADSAIDQVKGAIEREEEVLLRGSGGTGGFNLKMAIPIYYGYKSTTELIGWAFYEVSSSYNPVEMTSTTILSFTASADFSIDQVFIALNLRVSLTFLFRSLVQVTTK